MMKRNNSVTYYVLTLALFVLLGTACKDQQPSHIGHAHAAVVTQEIPQSFLKFYVRFLSDTTYQKNHILFPLKQKADGTKWTKDDWAYHKPYNEEGGLQQEFTNINGLILETISDGKGMYKMERRYMLSGDSYSMIYFNVMNAFENSDDWSKSQ